MSSTIVSYLALPSTGPSRIPPRLKKDMQSNYCQRFDYKTLISDVYIADGSLEIAFPPLFNLEPEFIDSTFMLEDAETELQLDFYHHDRGGYARSKEQVSAGDTLTISGDLGLFTAYVQPSGTSHFENQSVLVTQQKDNDLAWIAYWVAHHVKLHGIESVLIYDNCSTRYSRSDIERVLSTIQGLRQYLVINWPTPFGVTGGPSAQWDSDFGQHVFLRHSFSRFLRSARTVFVCDIDELLVSTSTRFSIVEEVEQSSSPVVLIKRREVVPIPLTAIDEDRPRTHDLYGYVPAEIDFLTDKYAYRPAGLALCSNHWLKVHSPIGVPTKTLDPRVAHIRHFDGIRMTWRENVVKHVENVTTWPHPVVVDRYLTRDAARLSDDSHKLCEAADERD